MPLTTPFVMNKIRNKNCYTVRKIQNINGRRRTLRVFSKCTTQKKAQRQLNLLNAYFFKKR